ncbi:helix-turn-helix domain-containing protein [Streptomyces sp. NPDC087894]|uniref:helix-turn-helix domain-containing protein n=1 Tax=Streptomyces sp. NPDC087894 TaxID=3365816 RepID=UPI003804235E
MPLPGLGWCEVAVHPNTCRYRVRKAASLTGRDLDDSEHRLAAMLQLRLSRGPSAPRPFPVADTAGPGSS